MSDASREGGRYVMPIDDDPKQDHAVRRAAPRRARFALALGLGCLTAGSAAAAPPAFLAFESGPVRPLALSPDGQRLYAVNTPDARLEILAVEAAGLRRLESVPVGLEPVAVAVRPNGEVWVVNHLSDSISIVDPVARRVVRTLLVGDEPRDVVFAGPGRRRAFVTTARRGQRRAAAALAGVPGAGDARLTTPGVPRADVWVFDADALGADFGGVPLAIVELFGDTPRALAATPNGATVYAAVLHSGNRTATLHETFVCDGFQPAVPCTIAGVLQAPGGLPPPATNVDGAPAPEVAMIVRQDAGTGIWRDVIGRDWSTFVRFDLPDQDVFAIDAASLAPVAAHAGVGTTLFNMLVHPTNGRLYVSNTESQNLTRFEGPGDFGGSTVQGHLAESRITVIDGATVTPRRLNPHLDYAALAASPVFDPTARFHSLATPLEMAISTDGATLYVAAFGSGRVGVLPTAALDAGTLDPRAQSDAYLPVSGGGPAGLVLDEPRGRLYVATRFDVGVSVVDLTARTELQHLRFHNPEPAAVVAGRRFLYDAMESSANGEASCASCHVFGDLDHLAWDLGDPDAAVTTNPIPILNPAAAVVSPTPINGTGEVTDFHPMKGPMTTQTLRGMATHGAMHWRGDRATGAFGTDAFDEDLSFRNFVVAFEGLLGRETPLPDAAMQQFADFALALVLPPNPVRALDNALTPAQQAGRTFYLNTIVDGPRTCNGCHRLDAASGFFGTGGEATFEGNSQIFKVPHLRNMYTKVGMFGMLAPGGGGIAHQGDQVRGFGYSHNGAVDTLFRFVSGAVFNFPNDTARREMEQFMLAFDSDLAPVVGQQVTLDAATVATASARVDLLLARAATPFTSAILGGTTTECEVVVHGTVGGRPRGWQRLADGRFRADDDPDATATLTDAALRAVALTEGPLTYTCVPPGSGERMGVDRDGDAWLDGVDNCPERANGDQADADGDQVGDACDPESCGDGFVGGLEGCDDGNTDAGDGCDAACLPEPGFACTGEPSGCWADVVVAGTKLLLRRTSSGKEQLVLQLKDTELPFPPIGSADDPASGTPGGMQVELLSAGEGRATFSVPPGLGSSPGWTVRDGGVGSYKYRNGAAPGGPTPVGQVLLKEGKLLKVRADATGLPLARTQGRVAVRVTMGRTRFCARFDGAAVTTDEAAQFKARKAAAPAAPNCTDAGLGMP